MRTLKVLNERTKELVGRCTQIFMLLIRTGPGSSGPYSQWGGPTALGSGSQVSGGTHLTCFSRVTVKKE